MNTRYHKLRITFVKNRKRYKFFICIFNSHHFYDYAKKNIFEIMQCYYNLFNYFFYIFTAPGRDTDEVLIGEVDIAMRNDDEYVIATETTSQQPFDKTCIVDGKIYTHSQMVSLTSNNTCKL